MLKHYLPLAIVPVALMLWGIFGATQLATASFGSLVRYRTPYTVHPAPGAEGAAVSEHVVLILADGMRLDVSQTLPNLNALRKQGADRSLRIGLPSLSLPGWTVISTGAWQEQHGQTTNFGSCDGARDGKPATVLCPAQMDSIFAAAKRKGYTTALGGTPTWQTLLPGVWDTALVAPDPPNAHMDTAAVTAQNDQIEANSLRILKEQNPNLTLIYFSDPDNASHGYGVFGPQGQAAAQSIDARVGRIIATLDLNTTTVLFTSDHGHIARGGHAGDDPEVMIVPLIAAGRGIVPGAYPAGRQADVAPTIAALLGSSFPADNQGTALFDMLSMGPNALAARTVDWASEIAARYDSIVKVIGVTPPGHPALDEARLRLAMRDTTGAIASAQAEVDTARSLAGAVREGRLLQERLARTPLLLLLVAPLAIYVWFMRRMQWEFKRPVIAAIVYVAVYYAIFFGRGYWISLSMLNDDTRIGAWFAERTVDAIIALVAASAVLGVLSRDEYRVWTVLNTFNAAFIVAAALWLQICGFYWLWDFTWPWYLPDITQGFKYYLDVLQTGAFTVVLGGIPIPVILILPLVALGAQWLTARILPPAEHKAHATI
ncbi:MAG: alkaline phosphatase family protein [Chloroflexi bacterium]|nr:alkaline phosphatase family protein [Chloroflexota bacterium]